MSGYTPIGFKKGFVLLVDGEEKTVADWHFIANSGYWAGLHNSDVIVIKFTDGTISKGWSGIKVPGQKKYNPPKRTPEQEKFLRLMRTHREWDI